MLCGFWADINDITSKNKKPKEKLACIYKWRFYFHMKLHLFSTWGTREWIYFHSFVSEISSQHVHVTEFMAHYKFLLLHYLSLYYRGYWFLNSCWYKKFLFLTLQDFHTINTEISSKKHTFSRPTRRYYLFWLWHMRHSCTRIFILQVVVNGIHLWWNLSWGGLIISNTLSFGR